MADAARAPGPLPRRADRYDTIGRNYAERRRPEPAWARAISSAIGDATRVVNVGAGSGNYEPTGCAVVGLEPSSTMLQQRPTSAAPCVQGVAEALPFADLSFDVALAILTTHHWIEHDQGMAELRRVAPRQVVVTWDPVASTRFWLLRDYLPQLHDFELTLPSVDAVTSQLSDPDVVPLLVPRGCVDGFAGARWEDPRAYLDPTVRSAMSGLSLLDQGVVDAALARLERDLDDGTWHAANRELAGLDAFDAGYRLVVAGPARCAPTARPVT